MRIFVILSVISAVVGAVLVAGGSQAASPKVVIQLTYPSGASPKVFTKGWLFGTKATANGKDVSSQVRWSGTGTFSPAKGTTSRPAFRSAGSNSITLSVDYAGETFSKKFPVNAVLPDKYAAMGDFVTCPSDSHGCTACPHSVKGSIGQGSPQVLVRGKPAARKGDGGRHNGCCGPNTFKITGGDPSVLINGKPAARKGDKTQHCGGVGQIGISAIKEGGQEVFTGPTGPSSMKLTISGSSVTGTLSANQQGVKSGGTIDGTYDRKSGAINAQVKGSTTVAGAGKGGGSTWSGPLKAKRVDNEITGTFNMTVRSGSTTMSDTIPVKLKRVN